MKCNKWNGSISDWRKSCEKLAKNKRAIKVPVRLVRARATLTELEVAPVANEKEELLAWPFAVMERVPEKAFPVGFASRIVVPDDVA